MYEFVLTKGGEKLQIWQFLEVLGPCHTSQLLQATNRSACYRAPSVANESFFNRRITIPEKKYSSIKQMKIMSFLRGDCLGRLWDARWQKTYQVYFHFLRSSEPAQMSENNGFYLLSLLPPSVPKVLLPRVTRSLE